MPSCCDGEGYDAVFTDRFARRVARRYRKRGLDATSTRIVDFLTARGIEDASVLEIGGGVGEIQLELLRRGASRVTNLEISGNYEAEARRLQEQSGLGGRVTRRFLDIAQAPDEVEPADVVVLHRVVCCYPDYDRLLAAAGGHARRLLVFSHPPENVLSRGVIGAENLLRRLQRQSFRAFVHPADAMVSALARTGLAPSYVHRGRAWCVVGLER
jgi:magnesium-protoporphyrin O-methyltransferase